MKKIAKGIIACAAVSVLACGLAFAACGGEETVAATYTITFDYNYTGAPAATTQTVEEGQTATKPADPSREGYTFNDWYTASTGGSVVDFTKAITADATYYAQWDEVVVYYTVTAYLDSSTTETYTVAGGTTLSVDTPTADGKVFSGWYTDSDCTTAFDVTTPITSDITIYADWMDFALEEGNVAIYYWFNDGSGSVYTIEQVKSGRNITSLPASPTREGYTFKNWYTDANCENVFNSSSYGSVSETLNLYAAWNCTYVFEAEYTNLNNSEDEGRKFYGYSNNYTGDGAIMNELEFDGQIDYAIGASNGMYVAGIYQKGAYIEFEIYSSKAVNDAMLTLRCSCEGGWYSNPLVFTQDNLTVSINGTAMTSFSISMDTSSLDSTRSGPPLAFADFYLGNISLVAGSNTIRIQNNSSTAGQGGTQYNEGILTDCIKITTDATLTMTEYNK